jgi:hypothetical protein
MASLKHHPVNGQFRKGLALYRGVYYRLRAGDNVVECTYRQTGVYFSP